MTWQLHFNNSSLSNKQRKCDFLLKFIIRTYKLIAECVIIFVCDILAGLWRRVGTALVSRLGCSTASWTQTLPLAHLTLLFIFSFMFKRTSLIISVNACVRCSVFVLGSFLWVFFFKRFISRLSFQPVLWAHVHTSQPFLIAALIYSSFWEQEGERIWVVRLYAIAPYILSSAALISRVALKILFSLSWLPGLETRRVANGTALSRHWTFDLSCECLFFVWKYDLLCQLVT